MNQEILALLTDIPDHADYACAAEELDLVDISQDRIDRVVELLHHTEDVVVFDAAKLLTHWGQDEGFNALTHLFDTNQLSGWIDHRLQGYDDTLQHVLSAFVSYWAEKSDAGLSELARGKIFPYVAKIIEQSNTAPFEINSIFWVIEKKQYREYIPLLKTHLDKMMDDPKLYFWKIHDAIQLMLKFDTDFVYHLLQEKGKSLKDFRIEC
ncbi:hypothetical protein [Acinetobacter gyllenbergii]|uniref:hypothetical protein n=1 Tax=Acinetobacter gyllenbergii TaxID=134534 RepID=UPI000806B1D0|nr:hypothetical protein [Acinetobacter gyllenbergii]OBY75552.1 hypothetical protein NG55_02445 [Acinetobacter gyllenbergii]